MVDAIILEYNEKEYRINIEILEKLDRGAKGQYLPETKTILLLNKCDVSTIYHESIHAIIDMFKSSNESFDGIFYDKLNYGEEAFCHYVCDLSKSIIDFIF